MRIQAYSEKDKTRWDDFILTSKNGTFLFFRDYMEYHSDRFKDHSLIVEDEKGAVVSVFPANLREDILESHGGLTYGGFVLDMSMTMPMMLDIFSGVLEYLREKGLSRVIYKTIPHIYHFLPAEEDRYALYLYDAKLIRRDVLSVLDLDRIRPFQQRRQRGIKKAKKNGIECLKSENFQMFWIILSNNLEKKYKVKPVHNSDEMALLRNRFKDNIKFFASFKDNAMLAGLVVYESRNVAHIQYAACSEEGKKSGALDILYDYIINDIYRGRKKYIDFGISTEKQGSYLNAGLIEQKEGFGARTVVHDFYSLELSQDGGRL
ncbi:GNAT family N-acetyltransferase [Acidobacteriota bacterium]